MIPNTKRNATAGRNVRGPNRTRDNCDRSVYGAGIPEIVKFQEYFREKNIFGYYGLSCEEIMFEGQV